MPRSISRSVRRRCSMRWAIVMSLSPCSAAYGTRSGTRAIVPSSLAISQITPAGISPARRARSTAASVWPARSSTPPGLARSGKTWPGLTRSSGPESGSMATMIVRERSGAEMPVVMPWRASIASVKAVALGASLRRTIGLRPSWSQRSSVSERQISPRPCVAMKLMASGVANCAAITRSPSFSRSSESRITTMRPARISSIASATVAKRAVLLVIRRPPSGAGTGRRATPRILPPRPPPGSRRAPRPPARAS